MCIVYTRYMKFATKCLSKILKEETERSDIAVEIGSIIYDVIQCKGKLANLITVLESPIKNQSNLLNKETTKCLD